MSCATDRCRAVGASEGGGVPGGVKRGVVCRAVEISHSRGVRCGTDKISILVNVARKALNWTKGMRWSGDSGSVIVPSRERCLKLGASGNKLLAEVLGREV
jgi:hypothetical protein